MPLRIGAEMPSLEGATEWLNATGAAAEAESKGRPVLVHFWSVSCGTCKENLPRVAEWRDGREGEGLRVVAVHMPRQPADTDVESVRDCVSMCNITEPCAVDNEHKLRDAFGNEQGYVPAYYLFDAEGKLRGYAAGERGLNMIGPALERVMDAFKAASRGEGQTAPGG
ncbi:MAG TPA: redoxin domain-containing protein [Pyrinomonadaceae bacterium]|nr:redoxin domain-containing protein [Pyrinomonadaceae bacterium]